MCDALFEVRQKRKRTTSFQQQQQHFLRFLSCSFHPFSFSQSLLYLSPLSLLLIKRSISIKRAVYFFSLSFLYTLSKFCSSFTFPTELKRKIDGENRRRRQCHFWSTLSRWQQHWQKTLGLAVSPPRTHEDWEQKSEGKCPLPPPKQAPFYSFSPPVFVHVFCLFLILLSFFFLLPLLPPVCCVVLCLFHSWRQ